MKVVAVVQARLGSIRLPEKVLRPIANKPMIEILLNRLSMSSEIDEILVATSNKEENDKLQSFVEALDFRCTRGSEEDVLSRFYDTARLSEADIVVRITGDCPLVDPGLVDKCIKGYKENEVDYFSNIQPTTFPDGLDIEVLSMHSLEKAHKEAISNYDREHVTTYIRNSDKFSKCLSTKGTKILSNSFRPLLALNLALFNSSLLSLIHISEPTRQEAISYAVVCV